MNQSSSGSGISGFFVALLALALFAAFMVAFTLVPLAVILLAALALFGSSLRSSNGAEPAPVAATAAGPGDARATGRTSAALGFGENDATVEAEDDESVENAHGEEDAPELAEHAAPGVPAEHTEA